MNLKKESVVFGETTILSQSTEEVNYQWKIVDFHELSKKNTQIVSPTVTFQNKYKWQFIILNADVISIFLRTHQPENSKPYWQVYCTFKFTIINEKDEQNNISKTAHNFFSHKLQDWGFRSVTHEEQLNLILEDNNGSLVINFHVSLKKDLYYQTHLSLKYDSKVETNMIGIKTTGKTFYLNSILQMLFHIAPFRKKLYSLKLIKPNMSINRFSNLTLALQHLFYKLQFFHKSFKPKRFLETVGWNKNEDYIQHEPQELQHLIFEKVGEYLKDEIDDLFKGKVITTIKCSDVDYQSTKEEEYYELFYSVKECSTLVDSFIQYISPVYLVGDNQYKTENFGLQDSVKTTKFLSFPSVLNIYLNRFDHDEQLDFESPKVVDRYAFPDQICLNDYLDSSVKMNNDYTYDLYAVLVHSGIEATGYYYLFLNLLQDNKENWFNFHDGRVTKSSYHQALERNYGGKPKSRTFVQRKITSAYMLVYIRRCEKDKLLKPVEEDDIPKDLIKSFEQRGIERKKRREEKKQSYLYTKLRIVFPDQIKEIDHDGFGITNWKKIKPIKVLKTLTIRELKDIVKKQIIEKQNTKNNVKNNENVNEKKENINKSKNENEKTIKKEKEIEIENEKKNEDKKEKEKEEEQEKKEEQQEKEEKEEQEEEKEVKEKEKEKGNPNDIKFNLWTLCKRQNKTRRFDKCISSEKHNERTLQSIPEFIGVLPIFYIEEFTTQPERNIRFITFKYYSAKQSKIRYLGTFRINQNVKLKKNVPMLKMQIGLPNKKGKLLFFEEIRKGWISPINPNKTPRDLELVTGDIVCVQFRRDLNRKCNFPTVGDYFSYKEQEVKISLYHIEKPTKIVCKFFINLSNTYDHLVKEIGKLLSVTPSYLRIYGLDTNAQLPLTEYFNRIPKLNLLQLLTQYGIRRRSKLVFFYRVANFSILQLIDKSYFEMEYLNAQGEIKQRKSFLIPKVFTVKQFLKHFEKIILQNENNKNGNEKENENENEKEKEKEKENEREREKQVIEKRKKETKTETENELPKKKFRILKVVDSMIHQIYSDEHTMEQIREDTKVIRIEEIPVVQYNKNIDQLFKVSYFTKGVFGIYFYGYPFLLSILESQETVKELKERIKKRVRVKETIDIYKVQIKNNTSIQLIDDEIFVWDNTFDVIGIKRRKRMLKNPPLSKLISSKPIIIEKN
ncbi:ubiquitin carboxyl-terminal hydrolase [Anaeramoeba flamelloides]|uniref:ubiquitinyl hydrolase 1 n=1 Tax=Anaeramoeba flamelloides TaxID=1746091 RepID=A0AAV7YKX8_9EUKA|nr:ubiquitin carboxyl-terminal hydrolase [Anaeramoeba flamelloides]